MVSNERESIGEKCDVRNNHKAQNSQKPANIAPRNSNIEIKANQDGNRSDLPKETTGLSLADEIREINDVKRAFEKKHTDSTVNKKVRSQFLLVTCA